MGEMLKGKMNPDIVTYVPMIKKDLGERGYNQGCMIAREICKKVGGRLCGKALLKKRGNKKQALLDRRQRKNNVRDVFEARGEIVEGRKVLLVDDIMTTGSTIEECRNALVRAGAEKVEAAVLAYTPLK
jgi:ComF family protein